MIGRRRVREYRRFTVLGFLVAAVFWLVLVAVMMTLLVAAWPLVVAAAWAYAVAWGAGWPPRRLAVAAAWCVPMVMAFAIVYWAAGDGAWQVAAWSPVRAWLLAWDALDAGEWLRAIVIIAPTAIPAGLLLGAFAWRVRVGLMASGAADWSPAAPVAFDERQWRRSVRSAALRVRAPGGVPLLSRRGNPVLGAVIRSVGHRPRPVLELPYPLLRTHMLVVGTNGGGEDHGADPADGGILGGSAVPVPAGGQKRGRGWW